MELKRKAIMFSADALIAISLIFIVLFLLAPLKNSFIEPSRVQYDLLNSLSTLRVSDVHNSYIDSLRTQGLISNENNTILEQIGEFYVTNTTLANQFATNILSSINEYENIGIWYGSTLIFSRNKTSYQTAKHIEVSRAIISGLQEGNGSVAGFSARASLENALQKKYIYFGGYVGEGNLSQTIVYYGNITSANIEVAINNNFTVYVNGNKVGDFQKSSSDYIPSNYNLSTSYFHKGLNLIEISGYNLHISGGFVRIIYESDVMFETSTMKFLPGIHGIINLYDGLQIRGNLTSLDVFLHMNSTENPTYFNIGNTTLFNNKTNGEERINFTNAYLSTILDYNQLSSKTTPFRLGILNATYAVNTTLDLISVYDFTTSMACSVVCGNCGNSKDKCEQAGGVWLLPLNNSQKAHHTLINTILPWGGTRIGLLGYHSSIPTSNNQQLTDNATLLNSKVDSWDSTSLHGSNRKLCNAIIELPNQLQNSTAIKFAIVMSAGQIDQTCSGISAGDLNANGISNDAGDQAIKATCDNYIINNITTYSVGYGADADEATLQAIATCGHGEYYYANIENLTSAYENIIHSILTNYRLQTVLVSVNSLNRLYPDSYISYTQTAPSIPYGLLIKNEKIFDSIYGGTLDIPASSTLVDVSLTSYSGTRWTDYVYANNFIAYNLSRYGKDYALLGDPYLIGIPNSLIHPGRNTINLTTGSSPENSTSGSAYNKIISTLVTNLTTFSPISPKAEGCNWFIQFDDLTNITLQIPSSYAGTDDCSFSTLGEHIENENDAAQLATLSLLRLLDTNNNTNVDTPFNGEALTISTSQISGIPFVYSTEVQIRRWQ